MSVELPGLGNLVDIRQPIAGDSFNWSGTEPTAAKKSLVYHHSASDALTVEDGFSIAEYHVNHNGWGGIGYHLVITSSQYQGRPGQTPPGAQIQYVGDLGTYRAHVANQNPGRVGICFVGFTPDAEQLRLARQLNDYFIAPNMILPSINFYNQVTVHRLVPDQSTACPGDDYGNWLPYLQGGEFPAYLQPSPQPPTPEPAPAQVVVSPPVDNRPDYEQTWNPTPVSPKIVAVPSADITDVSTGQTKGSLAGGTAVNDLAGTFTHNGNTYVRTVYATTHNLWNGILLSELKDPDAVVPAPSNPANPVDSIQPPVASGSIFDLPGEPVVMQDTQKVGSALGGLWEALVAILLSPLRLIGLITKALSNLKGN